MVRRIAKKTFQKIKKNISCSDTLKFVGAWWCQFIEKELKTAGAEEGGFEEKVGRSHAETER